MFWRRTGKCSLSFRRIWPRHLVTERPRDPFPEPPRRPPQRSGYLRFRFRGRDRSEILDFICQMFQKRHLLSHKMGVIDDEYVQKANDPAATAGRKVVIGRDEVQASPALLQRMGDRLYDGILPKTIEPHSRKAVL